MKTSQKLSVFLNSYHSYHEVKDISYDEILKITSRYIDAAIDAIYKQPIIAQQAIMMELEDILIHHSKFQEEALEYNSQLNRITSKGPKIGKEKLALAMDLEEKRNTTVEFVYTLEDSLAFITRTLLEHYSELKIDKPFLEKFSGFLGRFDRLGRHAEQLFTEANTQQEHQQGIPYFEQEVVKRAQELIKQNEIVTALEFLLLEVQDENIKNDLILLNQELTDIETMRRLGLDSNDNLRTALKRVVNGILSILLIRHNPEK